MIRSRYHWRERHLLTAKANEPREDNGAYAAVELGVRVQTALEKAICYGYGIMMVASPW